MIKAFEFDNYRKFMKKRLSEMPNRGYGQLSQLARHLNVHPTLVSQIMKGQKSLTTDQAALSAEFFGLSELETEYFVTLVQVERAGPPAAKSLALKLLRRLKEQSQQLSKRLSSEGRLSDEQRAVFYSDWTYSAVRQSVALPEIQTVEEIAAHLGLPLRKVQLVMDFLLKTGLCKSERGSLKVGPASTYVEAGSPWARVHHGNWRQRALSVMDRGAAENLHFSSPLTISRADAERVREKLVQFIEEINQIVDPSPSEELYCLNFDWFAISPGLQV